MKLKFNSQIAAEKIVDNNTFHEIIIQQKTQALMISSFLVYSFCGSTITVAVTFLLSAFSDLPRVVYRGYVWYMKGGTFMETVSLCVSILSLVVSAVSLGIALESRKK